MNRNVPLPALPFLLLAFSSLAGPAAAQGFIDDPEQEGTFSIIGRDPETGELGIAVHSKTVAVGSRVRGGKGGVAVFAHQAGSNPLYSRLGVELLEAGWTPQEALDFLVRGDAGRNSRQVAVLDIHGRTAAYTSETISDWKGHRCGVDFCAQGNTLTGPEVVDAMARSFEASTGTAPLAERLLDALQAGQDAGGDRRGVQSAGLLILRPRSIQDFGDWALDLRVDEHKDPFGELRRVLDVRRAGEILSGVNSRLNEGDLAGAMEVATAALEKAPELDNVWVAIANVHLRAGRRSEALSALARAVELNPANRSQLPRNATFEALHEDPQFLAIVGG